MPPRPDRPKAEGPMHRVAIRLKRNGPYIIDPEYADLVEILDADGQPVTPAPGRIVLCRCGGSATKPFCDGTHRQNGFVGGSSPGQPA